LAWSYFFCASVGQSPALRTNGQSQLLLQDAGAEAGLETGAFAGALTAGGLAGLAGCAALIWVGVTLTCVAAPPPYTPLPLFFISASVRQSPGSRTNGQSKPLLHPAEPEPGALAGRLTAEAFGALAGCVTLTGVAGPPPLTPFPPLFLSVSVWQSPESRTNGHNQPLLHPAELGAVTLTGTPVTTLFGVFAGWVTLAWVAVPPP
jgi:hypothetical protein